MYFCIYETINLIDGKRYVGKHQTQNLYDSYLGSGRLLRVAITKYGCENFQKTILHICSSLEEMNEKEREIVTREFCDRDDTYNLCPGGHGGWGYINNNGINKFHGHQHTTESKLKQGHGRGGNHDKVHMKKIAAIGGLKNKGRPKSVEHRRKISESLRRKAAA